MAWPTSWVDGATPPPYSHQPFTSRQALLQPDTAHNCTRVLKLINQRTRVWVRLEGRGKGQRSPIAGHAHPHINRVCEQTTKATPKLWTLTHARTAHSRLGTPTSHFSRELHSKSSSTHIVAGYIFNQLKVIKRLILALMWAITGLSFRATSCR